MVEKINNEIQNIFINDKENNLSNLSSNSAETKETTITAQSGIINQKKWFVQRANYFF